MLEPYIQGFNYAELAATTTGGELFWILAIGDRDRVGILLGCIDM